ncbi:WXG100 family type VII secretion target [Paenibacillus sp. PDC88]|uniref:WXG100 family type VII secretion target n=1 Tax=Paenibacillus sp. PDC88 TaxID=1884375 RepID=UPI0008951E60|nr:WXG100 family type VII secretion target [Paenibacillus sp. PDC88]SDX43330.1 WXG100 family type VII secretion target [Paenibacillus sp. PDC88]
MTRIKVPIDVLLSVSDQFDNASNQLKMINENLLRQIFMLMSNWYGQRGTAFQTDFKTAYEQMNVTIERMHVISQELKGIAVRFMDADQLQDFMGEQRMELFAKLSTTNNVSEPPKSFLEKAGDVAADFGSGVKKGLGDLGDSLKDTATNLYEDPIGTLGDMAYNATIGTAEDIKGAVVWGNDMVMDDEKREAFWDGTQAKIQESGGFPNYLGEQAAVVLGSAAISRVGIKGGSKLKHESDKAVEKADEGLRKTGASNSSFNGQSGQGLGKLEGKELNVTQKGLNIVKEHLSQNFGDYPENSAMIERLEDALVNKKKISGADASFYMHEVSESTIMKKGIDYDTAHEMALEKYEVSRFSVYHPDVIKSMPDIFNKNWRKFWGLDE